MLLRWFLLILSYLFLKAYHIALDISGTVGNFQNCPHITQNYNCKMLNIDFNFTIAQVIVRYLYFGLLCCIVVWREAAHVNFHLIPIEVLLHTIITEVLSKYLKNYWRYSTVQIKSKLNFLQLLRPLIHVQYTKLVILNLDSMKNIPSPDKKFWILRKFL